MSKTMKIRVKFDKALIKSAVKEGGRDGLFAALDHLRTVSMDQVPLDQGTLKASCMVDVDADGTQGTVSYDTPYAVTQHENVTLNHQRGRKAKYLEDPVNDPAVQKQMETLLRDSMAGVLGGKV